MRSVVAIVFCVLGVSCITQRSTPDLRWTTDFVTGLEVKLTDPRRIEYYFFNRHGLVGATLGTKEAMMGPLWYWKIDGDKLQISGGSQIQDEWTLLRRDEQTITVRRITGKTQRYHYRKATKA